MKLLKITTSLLVLAICISVFVPFLSKATSEKEYREGEFISISGKNYLAVSNSQSVEILEVSADDKLIKINEIFGMEAINDLVVNNESNKTYLFISTGQYIYKYNITNPFLPKIEFRKDLYQYSKGRRSIGYSRKLAQGGNYMFTCGTKGVRGLEKNYLGENITVSFEPCYGIAANNDRLAVVEKNTGKIFNINTNELIADVSLKNSNKEERVPSIDSSGNVYFPSDNSLIKVRTVFKKQEYINPVAEGLLYSYSSSALLNSDVYYVNGFGVTHLDNNFNKSAFHYLSRPSVYGSNSWAAGVASRDISNGKRLAVFNKSSVILLDDSLNFLDQYTYKSLFNDEIITDLSIIINRYWGISGENINIKLYGFWPNEEVRVNFGTNEYINKHLLYVDNIGSGVLHTEIPEIEQGTTVIWAKGLDSGLSYQVSFEIK